jgi:hypothetical protein
VTWRTSARRSDVVQNDQPGSRRSAGCCPGAGVNERQTNRPAAQGLRINGDRDHKSLARLPRRLGDQDGISSVNYQRTIRATARRYRSWSTLIPKQHPLLGVADRCRRAAWTAALLDLRKQRRGVVTPGNGGAGYRDCM